MSIHETEVAVGKVKNYIKTQRDLLQDSEVQTRVILIDPILNALGWETNNPNSVRQEYGMNNGKADYALIHPETQRPFAIIEAKKLGDERLERHIPQIDHYAGDNSHIIKYGVITNGNVWRVFESKNGLMYSNVLAISIASDSDAKCAVELSKILGAPIPEPKPSDHTAWQKDIPQNGVLWNEAIWR